LGSCFEKRIYVLRKETMRRKKKRGHYLREPGTETLRAKCSTLKPSINILVAKM